MVPLVLVVAAVAYQLTVVFAFAPIPVVTFRKPLSVIPSTSLWKPHPARTVSDPHPPTTTTTTTGTVRPARRSRDDTFQNTNKNAETREYIDDCFGLIFLTGFFVVHDPIFTASFVACSTVALLATRQGLLNPIDGGGLLRSVSTERQRRLVPAIAAATALVLSTCIATIVLFLSGTSHDAPIISQLYDVDANAVQIEAFICSISVIYGIASKVDDQTA